MSERLLCVEELSVDFDSNEGTVQVLDCVNFALARGEIVGLVGESGCGKSTLARAIMGSLPVHAAKVRSGRIMFDGIDLLQQTDRTMRREVCGNRITLIPQDPYLAFNPLFRVGTQIGDLMRWKSPAAKTLRDAERRRFDSRRILDVLAAVRIPDPKEALKKLPHEFSGGQLQRLMIAMAFLPKPELIIADEPTTSLDVTIQAQILRLLRRMADEEGVSVIFTTHDLATAYQLCDRIVVLYAGQEMEAAPTDAFFAAPLHPYTHGLLASIPGVAPRVRGIDGDMPDLTEPPRGCRFHPRCGRASGRCRELRPPVQVRNAAHSVRCFNAGHGAA